MTRQEAKLRPFHTYSFLSRSFVGFNFQLQLIYQILESCDILAVLLGL